MSGGGDALQSRGTAHPLTPIQHRAVELLSLGMKIAATARRLGIDERTIYRWKKQPAFAEAIRRGCWEPVTVSMLRQLTRPVRLKRPAYRFDGKVFHRAEEYLAAVERASPAAALRRRLRNGEV